MIPADIREQAPMLAQQSKKIDPDLDVAVAKLTSLGYFFDLKWDGIRCIAYVENGKAQLRNRRGRDITFRYPEIVSSLEYSYGLVNGGLEFVLDGEIVVLGADGYPDFPAIHTRDAQEDPAKAMALSKRTPAVFMAFDVLWYGGDDFRKMPYVARRLLLGTLLGDNLADSLRATLCSLDGPTMWAFVKEHKLEGLIAKRSASLYTPGRSDAWIKLKPVRTLSALVTGYTPGEGARAATFGALNLVLLDDDGTMIPIGDVGSGFTQASITEVLNKIVALEVLIVEVEFQDVSPSGQLRFPVFKGIRTDQEILDCSIDQLDHVPTQEWR